MIFFLSYELSKKCCLMFSKFDKCYRMLAIFATRKPNVVPTIWLFFRRLTSWPTFDKVDGQKSPTIIFIWKMFWRLWLICRLSGVQLSLHAAHDEDALRAVARHLEGEDAGDAVLPQAVPLCKGTHVVKLGSERLESVVRRLRTACFFFSSTYRKIWVSNTCVRAFALPRERPRTACTYLWRRCAYAWKCKTRWWKCVFNF